MYTHLRETTARQLSTLPDHMRLVIVHPNYTQAHGLLCEFLTHNPLYVRFSGRKLNLAALKEQFAEAISYQLNSDDLSHVSTIILDECDRTLGKALESFLKHILTKAPNSQIVVFSREIPQCVLDETDLRDQTAFLPTDPSLMLWDYTRRDRTNQLLEVHAFGEGRVYLNGKLISNWDGMLPRSLFFYLVDRGMTTRSDIFEMFWPSLGKREATNVFHVTKRKISEVLGIDLTTYWSGYYRISPDIELSYDAVLFAEMVQNAAIEQDPQTTINMLNRAVELYNGQFLQGIHIDWADSRRNELEETYAEALSALAQAQEQLGRKQEALGHYLQAIAHNPHDSEAIAHAMRLYREHGMHNDAL
ncbi:MAG: BTAD domain-containing putative transcriptional regulator, partial [Chloroflexota bacterium]